MTKKKIGTYHEKRGEDYLTVYKSDDGDVVQIEQYDARAAYSKLRGIDFFTESTPGLIKLLQKAAGIKVPKAEKIEYEYAVQTIDSGEAYPVFDRDWGSLGVAQEQLDRYTDSWERMGRYNLSAKIVKRRKAGEVEDA